MNLVQLPAGYTIDSDGVARRHGQDTGLLPGMANTAPKMLEAEWQTVVEDYARLHGWWAWHDTDPRRNREGFPDLVLIRDRVVWAELKSQTGRLRPGQAAMIARLEHAGAEVHVWRPDDWPTVQQVLA